MDPDLCAYLSHQHLLRHISAIYLDLPTHASTMSDLLYLTACGHCPWGHHEHWLTHAPVNRRDQPTQASHQHDPCTQANHQHDPCTQANHQHDPCNQADYQHDLCDHSVHDYHQFLLPHTYMDPDLCAYLSHQHLLRHISANYLDPLTHASTMSDLLYLPACGYCPWGYHEYQLTRANRWDPLTQASHQHDLCTQANQQYDLSDHSVHDYHQFLWPHTYMDPDLCAYLPHQHLLRHISANYLDLLTHASTMSDLLYLPACGHCSWGHHEHQLTHAPANRRDRWPMCQPINLLVGCHIISQCILFSIVTVWYMYLFVTSVQCFTI